MSENELTNPILAMLFVATDPVTLAELQEVYPETPREELRGIVDRATAYFNSLQMAVEIRQIGGGYRMSTRPEYHEDIRTYLQTKPSAKLSLAALETLAVIAYKQPVTIPEIMEIRGVNSGSTIRTLLEKRLIETRGRRKVVGRPIMYGTTKNFEIHFGLNNLSELPTLEELEEVLSPAVD
ncbi:MAG: SMC-Scp complex subunit ScpB [Acidobacteriota bacterium]|nr:SMC-Scp complex subunit ScpB [Acidobacteriota bacterium]